ncbi:CaiB/BaiF CoA transferase family protein [Pseudonocardia phyllosphaerae]|uniref:CaiB/BaiF CoA transferase family protein n=1 Tax=Pseudonocardia phyllosphaerae TaxID=3390502 RepID=UPI00397AD51B
MGTRPSLDGLRVVDLSRVLAGPYCAQMLADHGADVIKVEGPAGDETRHWGPPFLANGTSAYYTNLNRNKRNVVVDLGGAAGREVVDRLLDRADVVVENFKAGTLERWGWDRDTLRERFPRLVHCRITGFGVDGPLGGMPGYDAVLQAYSGLMSINGAAGGPPTRVGVPVVDAVTGMHAFSGILLALYERETSGLGQLVDVSLLDSAVSLLHPHSGTWLADGSQAPRSGSAHPTVAPYDAFPAADGPVFIGVGNDRQFGLLARALGAPELIEDPRFRHNPDRVRNRDTLRERLVALLGGRTRDEVTTELLAQGVPVSPVHDVGEALSSPQVRHRGLVVEGDGYRGIGVPVTLERSPGRAVPSVHRAGTDTRDVLAELGYDSAAIDAAITEGVVGER